MTQRRLTTALLYALFFISGGAGLGYQIVWTKLFAAGLGHEMPAVLAVVGAFLGGLALGAWALDRVVSRSARPGRWYAGLEIIIGLWGAASAFLIPLANPAAQHLIGVEPSPFRHWAIALLTPWLVLLPATVALGATLPAMERFLAPGVAGGRCVGGLYAANTLGAVCGTLGSTFGLLPWLGFRQTTWVLAALNLLCGAAAWWLGTWRLRTQEVSPTGLREGASPRERTPPPALSRGRLAGTVFSTGLLGIGFEVVGVRALAQVLENTVYTFAAVLAVYLLGTAAGAALYQRWGRRAEARRLLGDLLCGTTALCLVGTLALAHMPALYQTVRNAWGDSRLAVLAAEMAAAAAVFGLPTVLMGATFSHLAQAARREDGGVGWALAVNTLGGALAGVVFGVTLLPALGAKWTLVVIALGYLPWLPVLAGWRWAAALAPVALVLVLPGRLRHVEIPPDGRLLEYREGVMASVAVVRDGAGHRTLRVNNRFQMGGTAAAAAEYLQADLPLLLHPAPRRALFLGAGTGITLGAASRHPELRADGVELVPEVVEVMAQFEPENFAPMRHDRLKVFTADARRFVRASAEPYDVIVGDLFHPARDGAGALYTVEHFRAIRERLASGGLFCQWLPLHQLDEAMLRVITRTLLEVFPDATAWLLRFNVDTPVLGLVGRVRSGRYSADWLEGRLAHAPLAEHLKSLALADTLRLFGHLLAGPAELRAWAGQAPLNTDDHPRVTFAAPEFSFRRNASAHGRLESFLERATADPGAALDLPSEEGSTALRQRLATYVKARDVYLRGLMAEAEGRQQEAVDAFVESARLSEDFTAGYARCLSLASALAKTRRGEALALLERLVAAQPRRPVAGELIRRLGLVP